MKTRVDCSYHVSLATENHSMHTYSYVCMCRVPQTSLAGQQTHLVYSKKKKTKKENSESNAIAKLKLEKHCTSWIISKVSNHITIYSHIAIALSLATHLFMCTFSLRHAVVRLLCYITTHNPPFWNQCRKGVGSCKI